MKSFKDSEFIYEASLAGSTTFYKKNTGAFYQYVTLKPEIEFYELEKDAPLLQLDGTKVGEVLKKGTQIKILGREVKDLEKMGRSNTALISVTDASYRRYKDKKFRIAIGKILKPTGKNVETMKVDLSGKKNPNTFEPFKGGHGHEGKFTEAWIKGSGEEWQFEYKKKMYQIKRLSAPKWKGQGNPKTDVTVVISPGFYGVTDLKYSLKAENATYFENWMLPVRFKQIFGTNSQKILEDAVNEINNTGKIGGTTTKTQTICPFIKNGKHNSVALDATQLEEVISGKQKFAGTEGAANVFFGGKVPTDHDITKILDNTIGVKAMAKKLKAGLDFRGSSQMKNSSCFIKGDYGWYINPKGWGDLVDNHYTIPPANPKLIPEAKKDNDPCWPGYIMVGFKTKDGKRVPNCVPIEETIKDDKYAPGSKGTSDGWESRSKEQAKLRKLMWKRIGDRLRNKRSQNTEFDRKARKEKNKK